MKARIFNQACWIVEITDFEAIIKDFELLLEKSEFLVLRSIDHKFIPFGYTKIWLLGESHFAIHTFPEEKALYLELSSCVKKKAIMFWDNLQRWSVLNSKSFFLMQRNEYSPTKL